MTTKSTFIAGLLMTIFGASQLIAAQDSTPQHPAHEGPSVSIPASQIKFGPTGVKSNGLELKAGPSYGNLQTGKHGTFVKMPAGFSSAIHTHTEDYYAVVIKGVGTNHAPSDKDVPLPVGSYWFQKGEEPHVTKCLSKTDCLFFLVQPGKFDYVLTEKEKEQH
jgi:hypothetical protein